MADQLMAPWAAQVAVSPGWGRPVALGPTQARVFRSLVRRLGATLGRPEYHRLPVQREIAAELGMTVGRVSDTLADLSRLGFIDLLTTRGRLGMTRVRWTLRRWARRLRRVVADPPALLSLWPSGPGDPGARPALR